MEQATTQQLSLNCSERTHTGTGVSRRMRREHGQTPAIIYGGKKANQQITLEHKSIYRLAANKSIATQILSLQIGSETEDVLVKSIQRHPYKKQILHVDFMRVDKNKKMQVNAPLQFMGEDTAPGVKAGGIISHLATEIEVECLPKDLPKFIEVDVSHLENNQSLHLSELKLPSGVSLAANIDADHDPAIVSIHPPQAESTDEPNAEAAAEGETPKAAE